MKKARFRRRRSAGILKESDAGTPVKETCRTHEISDATVLRFPRGEDVPIRCRGTASQEKGGFRLFLDGNFVFDGFDAGHGLGNRVRRFLRLGGFHGSRQAHHAFFGLYLDF